MSVPLVLMDVPSLGAREERAEVRYVRNLKGQSETTMCREQVQSNIEGVEGEDGRTRRDAAHEEFFGYVVAGDMRLGNCRTVTADLKPTGAGQLDITLSFSLLFDFYVATRDNFDSGVTPFHQWCNRHKAGKKRRRRVSGVMLASLARQVTQKTEEV
jgi:hypothetical protein